MDPMDGMDAGMALVWVSRQEHAGTAPLTEVDTQGN